MIGRFPEQIRGEMRDFFARGLRAGIVYSSERSSNTDFNQENEIVTEFLPTNDRITPN